jgi:hypothetical protein
MLGNKLMTYYKLYDSPRYNYVRTSNLSIQFCKTK